VRVFGTWCKSMLWVVPPNVVLTCRVTCFSCPIGCTRCCAWHVFWSKHVFLHKYACLRQLRPRQVRVTFCPKSHETRTHTVATMWYTSELYMCTRFFTQICMLAPTVHAIYMTCQVYLARNTHTHGCHNVVHQ